MGRRGTVMGRTPLYNKYHHAAEPKQNIASNASFKKHHFHLYT